MDSIGAHCAIYQDKYQFWRSVFEGVTGTSWTESSDLLVVSAFTISVVMLRSADKLLDSIETILHSLELVLHRSTLDDLFHQLVG